MRSLFATLSLALVPVSLSVSFAVSFATPSFAEPLTSPDSVPTAAPAEPEVGKDTGAGGHAKKKKLQDANARFGVLGALGFPRPFSVEAMLNVEESVAVGVEYGYMPTLNVSGADVRYHALAGDLRIFPLGSSFFFGARVGKQHVDASGSLTVAGYGTYNESMSIDAWFVNPRVGFLYTHSSGFTVGVDAGLQIPLSHTESNSLPAALQPMIPQSITTVTNLFGTSKIPTVSLLQIGWLI